MFNKLFPRAAQSNDAPTPSRDQAAPVAPAAAEQLASLRALVDTGDLEQAAQHCTAYLQRLPGDLDGLALLFRVALKQKSAGTSLPWFQAGLQFHPESATLHFMLGYLLIETGETAAAIACLEKSLQLDASSAKTHNSLGSALQILGKFDEALQHYQAALALDPDCWRASYNIGNMNKLFGRFEDAVAPFQRALEARRGLDAKLSEIDVDDPRVTYSKLLHDSEQLHYLAQHGLLQGRADPAIDAYRQAMASPALEMGAQLSSQPAEVRATIAPYYNRLLHFYDAPALSGGAINQDQDWQAIAQNYASNGPGMTYFDNFLKPDALASLRRFCLESTIWFDFLYGAGYVGCTCEDGFICPLLAQIAEETKVALQAVIGNHRLNGLWGYKYDSQQSGISTHADFAAVNVNFWLTPDAANLAPEHGGLVVWDKEAPMEWDFEQYNSRPDAIAEFLRLSSAREYVVPHRQNRVVLFNSNLFHRTDDYHFATGYENRRINVTMLYGDRVQNR